MQQHFFFARKRFDSAAKMDGYENSFVSEHYDSIVKTSVDIDKHFAQIKNGIKEFKEIADKFGALIEAIINEMEEEEEAKEKEEILRDMKKRQIICIGVKESRNAATEEERYKDDRRSVEKIMHTIGCGSKINEIKMMRRVGQLSNNKDRILCIAFYDEFTKDNVLRFSNKLKDSNLRNVWLHKDLTNTQMQVLKARKKVKTSRKCG